MSYEYTQNPNVERQVEGPYWLHCRHYVTRSCSYEFDALKSCPSNVAGNAWDTRGEISLGHACMNTVVEKYSDVRYGEGEVLESAD